MSYSRFIEGDVYVIGTNDSLDCLWCLLNEGQRTSTTTRTAMIEHLKAHQAAGHVVPERAFEQLQTEIKEEGDTYATVAD